MPAALSFTPVTGTIGAEVRGFDVRRRHGDDTAAALRRGVAEHGVLFIDADGEVGDDELRTFGELFGETYSYSYGRRQESSALVTRVDHESSVGPKEKGTNSWHTDGCQQDVPPYVAALTPTTLPSVGGDTMWASMTAAFDALSSRWQRLLDGMDAVHSAAHAARSYSPEMRERAFGGGLDMSSVHPVVAVDPITGRRHLYVNSVYTERLVGMSDFESARVLQMLFDHVNTPEFHVRLRWRMGIIAVWHERTTQHRAVADFTERRTLRRVIVRGEPWGDQHRGVGDTR